MSKWSFVEKFVQLRRVALPLVWLSSKRLSQQKAKPCHQIGRHPHPKRKNQNQRALNLNLLMAAWWSQWQSNPRLFRSHCPDCRRAHLPWGYVTVVMLACPVGVDCCNAIITISYQIIGLIAPIYHARCNRRWLPLLCRPPSMGSPLPAWLSSCLHQLWLWARCRMVKPIPCCSAIWRVKPKWWVGGSTGLTNPAQVVLITAGYLHDVMSALPVCM